MNNLSLFQAIFHIYYLFFKNNVNIYHFILSELFNDKKHYILKNCFFIFKYNQYRNIKNSFFNNINLLNNLNIFIT